MSESEGKIAGAASIVGGATLLSRIFGYLRDVVIAYYFGAGLAADAFFVAFRVSNLFRRLVGEGSISSAIIPIFTGVLKNRSKDETKRFVSNSFTCFAIILALLTIVGIFFSKEFIWLIAPGFSENPEKLDLTIRLTRLLFPYMFFIGLVGVAMGVLNTLRRFAVPAFSPVIFNISMIVSALLLVRILDVPIYALVVGVLFGGLLQVLFHLPSLKREGLLPRPHIDLKDREMRKLFALIGPTVIGAGVYQINIFVTMRFASSLEEGSVAYLYYATRLMEFPLGVFAVAVSTAVLPTLSDFATTEKWDSFTDSLTFGIRLVNFVTIPATVGLILLGAPLVEALFMRGEFVSTDASATTFALYFYALGIVPAATLRMITTVFYSLKDTRTPLYVGIMAFLVNILFCVLLIGPLKHGGLALATTIAATVQFLVLVTVLRVRLGGLGVRKILASAFKSAVAASVMGGVIIAFLIFVPIQGASLLPKALFLLVAVGVGSAVYFLVARLIKAPEYASMVDLLLKRRAKNKV